MLKIKINQTALSVVIGYLLAADASAASLLERVEIETGTLLPTYTSKISTPFQGVAAYGNGDGVRVASAKLNNSTGTFQIAVQGASSNGSPASIGVFVGANKVGAVTFPNASPSLQTLTFKLAAAPLDGSIQFKLDSDTGANDTFLDWYELSYVGALPAIPAAPTLPATGAFFSGTHRNLFAEAGYSQADITAKVAGAYNQLFHSAQKDRITGQAIFITDPTDSSRAYIWDTGNNDVRSEGMSYGMMLAVQMNRQEDFNKLWTWANRYMLNTSGDMKGYFGWQKNVDGTNRDVNPAPDGEEYFVTSLFLAANRWGNGTGIYNYTAEANKLLDNMINNGQTRYVNGVLIGFSLFDKTANQILFSPYGNQFTDPSYHLPAFYELWARWAANNKPYWAQLAVNSRALWKKAVTSKGLNPDYSNFDGSVVTSASADHQVMGYDAWRTAGNAGLDFAWFKGDSWETTYAKSLHAFLKTQGTNYPSLYKLDGTVYNNNADHSPGFVAQNAMAGLASDSQDTWDFVNQLWDIPVPTGQYRYYDGSLYMLGLLAVSGNYKVYCPGNVVCNGSAQSSSSATSTSSSATTSSQRSSSSSIRSSSSTAITSSRSSVSSTSARSSSASSTSSQVGQPSAYIQIEAENYTTTSGTPVTKIAADGGTVANLGTSGSWISFTNVNFGTSGASRLSMRASDPGYGANIIVRLDSPTGPQIATLYPQGGGSYAIATNQVYPKPTGTHTIFISSTGSNVKINWFQFTQ